MRQFAMHRLSVGAIRRLLNLYGPNLGAAIRVDSIREDWREVRVSMKLRWYNRNANGAQFGGSLYSMVDPHYALMLMRNLGEEYVIWDKSAEIEYVSPGRGTVYATMEITEQEVSDIRYHTAHGEKYFPTFHIEVRDGDGRLVAKIKKVLYVRKEHK